MPKLRVYQLAKELKVQSALVLELLDRLGREVKSDLSSLDAGTADLVREKMVALLEREKQRIAEELALERERLAEEMLVAKEAPAVADRPVVEQPAVAPVLPAAAAVADPGRAAVQGGDAPVAIPAPTGRVFPAQRIPPGASRPGETPQRPTPPPTVPPRSVPGRPPTPPSRPAPPRFVPGRPGAPPHPAAGRPARPGGVRRKKKEKRAPAPPRQKPELPPVPDEIALSEAVTVKELAEKLNRKSKDVIARLLSRGVLANINQPLDPDVAVEVAKDFGSTATVLSFEEEAQKQEQARKKEFGVEGEASKDRPEDLQPRPPVVTVMGHVDHGKTSLLDAIRATDVVSSEHGGITQHIGAYQVEKKDRKITLLDTPGHEAFTMMRARGAKATDIVVLVVAADDGVKPQTIEAIDHARAAGVPIVVAINKIDKPESQPDRIKQQLAEQELVVEEYGGDIVSVEVSAKVGTGVDDLLEMLLLVADLRELKVNPDKHASGVVLETKLDRARGIVATVLVQEGTLKVGEPFIAGAAFGKVRAMSDDRHQRVDAAGPSTPVEVMGFSSEPRAGDTFQVVADEARARQIAGYRREKVREAELAKTARHITLENLSRAVAESRTVKELPILLNGDVQGSLEAIQKSLGELPSDKVRIKILRASIGPMTQADVLLASASNAIIVGFNVRPDRSTADLAARESVEIRLYTVIYDLRNEVQQAMVGMLEPELREEVLGQAEARELFKVPKIGTIAGCYVTDGKVVRSAEVRLLRDNVVIYTGKVGSLRRFKDDVSEVKQGFECGIGIANYNDLKQGDVIEFFVIHKVAVESL